MKKTITYLLIFLGFVSCNETNKDFHLITPEKGFDNVIIDKTSLNDIIQLYGKDYKADTFYNSPTREIYSIKYTYNKLGLSFFFKPYKKTVFAIDCKLPFKVRTENSIYLDSRTFKDVEKVYGEKNWSIAGNTLSKRYNGIEFEIEYEGVIPLIESTSIWCIYEYRYRKVAQITISKQEH